MAETGGDFLFMHVSTGRVPRACSPLSALLPQHDDIIRMIYKLAVEAGATVHFNTEVTSIHQGSDEIPNPSVTLVNGDVLTADVLIGADGYKSRVRDIVLEEEDNARPAGMTLYTGVVNSEDMLKDPELRPYALSDEVRSVCHTN